MGSEVSRSNVNVQRLRILQDDQRGIRSRYPLDALLVLPVLQRLHSKVNGNSDQLVLTSPRSMGVCLDAEDCGVFGEKDSDRGPEQNERTEVRRVARS